MGYKDKQVDELVAKLKEKGLSIELSYSPPLFEKPSEYGGSIVLKATLPDKRWFLGKEMFGLVRNDPPDYIERDDAIINLLKSTLDFSEVMYDEIHQDVLYPKPVTLLSRIIDRVCKKRKSIKIK